MTTTETTYSKSQLARILSALTEKRANPNSREQAMAAIERTAAKLGLTTNEVYAAADGLLDGRIPDQHFLSILLEADPPRVTEEPEAATDEPAEAEAEIIIPTKSTPKQDLLAAAKRAAEVLAEHEIEADTLTMLRAAIERVENGSRRARAATTKEPRGQTKQEAMVEMLSREEGATVAEMAEAMGWQAHTVRGAMAGALRKKLGLNVVTTGKVDGRGRVYHIDPQPAA